MKPIKRPPMFLLGAALVLYSLMSYGGVRSPDSELVFRVGENLASSGSFELRRTLERWPGFGVAKGRDGKLYGVVAPGESLAAVPFIWLGRALNDTGWYAASGSYVPPSHFVGDGLVAFMRGVKPSNPEMHALRFVASFLNVVVTAIGVVLFWLCAERLTRCSIAASAVSVLYAFGTLAWPYAGTFFSEPLATLFVLLSFYGLLRTDPRLLRDKENVSIRHAYLAGLSLGAAVATHITAILFLPFFLAYAAASSVQIGKKGHAPVRVLVGFIGGCAVPLALLGYYNAARFGNPLETGRTVDPDAALRFGYARFTAPWRGLYGLLLSSGKGLFLYSPAVLLGVLGWPALYRRYPALSLALAGAAVTRVVFIAAFTGWHGGFCLGPRYLVPLLPFLLFPACTWLQEKLDARSRRGVVAFCLITLACVSEQIFLSLGEVFSYYHGLRIEYLEQLGFPLFENDRLYLDWAFSPLLHLIGWKRAPFLLQRCSYSNLELGGLMTLVAGCLLLVGYRALVQQARAR